MPYIDTLIDHIIATRPYNDHPVGRDLNAGSIYMDLPGDVTVCATPDYDGRQNCLLVDIMDEVTDLASEEYEVDWTGDLDIDAATWARLVGTALGN